MVQANDGTVLVVTEEIPQESHEATTLEDNAKKHNVTIDRQSELGTVPNFVHRIEEQEEQQRQNAASERATSPTLTSRSSPPSKIDDHQQPLVLVVSDSDHVSVTGETVETPKSGIGVTTDDTEQKGNEKHLPSPHHNKHPSPPPHKKHQPPTPETKRAPRKTSKSPPKNRKPKKKSSTANDVHNREAPGNTLTNSMLFVVPEVLSDDEAANDKAHCAIKMGVSSNTDASTVPGANTSSSKAILQSIDANASASDKNCGGADGANATANPKLSVAGRYGEIQSQRTLLERIVRKLDPELAAEDELDSADEEQRDFSKIIATELEEDVALCSDLIQEFIAEQQVTASETSAIVMDRSTTMIQRNKEATATMLTNTKNMLPPAFAQLLRQLDPELAAYDEVHGVNASGGSSKAKTRSALPKISEVDSGDEQSSHASPKSSTDGQCGSIDDSQPDKSDVDASKQPEHETSLLYQFVQAMVQDVEYVHKNTTDKCIELKGSASEKMMPFCNNATAALGNNIVSTERIIGKITEILRQFDPELAAHDELHSIIQQQQKEVMLSE